LWTYDSFCEFFATQLVRSPALISSGFLVEMVRNALLSYISALASQYHPSEARADDQNLEDDEDDSDFEDEVVGTTNPPAKRRAVTRSQTSGKAAGVTPVLVQDLPAPSRGKAEKEEDSDADDLGEGEESDIEDVE
jgi:hypothetical protein